MAYTIRDGMIEQEGAFLEAEHLFKLGRILANSSDAEVELVISKRPARIHFEFEAEPTPNFLLFFRGKLLDKEQTHVLVNYGYFITDGRRLHFVSSHINEYLSIAFGTLSLPKLMKLLRSLYLEGLIDEFPAHLIELLRDKQKKQAHHEKLFVKSLYPYQEEGVNWLSFCAESGVGTILADDMGLGKTAQVIALCCDVLEKSSNSKILIVVPNPLLDNWVREFQFFAPSITPYIHYGKNRRGVASAFDEHNVVITPYTTMSSDITMFEDMYFELALFDEASMLKNPKSSRSLSARRLNIGVTVAMSGTPVENSLMDAWALTDLVFEGFLGEQDSFKSRYVHSDLSETLNENLEELENSLRQITLRRMKKDVLEQLPEKLDIHTAVSLGETEKAMYESLIDEMQRDNECGGSGILPLINKLQQFTAHPALVEPTLAHDVNSLIKHSAKFELLMIQMDKIVHTNEKVIIFATFQKAIDLIQRAIKERYGILSGVIDGRTPNDERQSLIDEFSSSKGFDVLLLHPRTAGMGLNITAATNVIHYCRQWNPALEEQATARAWRNGQKSIVNVYYMYYAHTIEEKIDERIRLKQQLSERVVSVTDDKETDKQIMLAYLETLVS
ncbi:DEAD/DEAH box helicase [Vibrio penaeicida]|uniref:DEAD/DEAH box helicase n=1 Tax=Vibrio penaeicida TaxID=104609 RepID=UPI002733D12B|nr:DEAD/DEAH box helicase [Vibrio penaeicida]MDP2572470.1 DEAD/DEAH box helicase [Vibrio penaeicida]